MAQLKSEICDVELLTPRRVSLTDRASCMRGCLALDFRRIFVQDSQVMLKMNGNNERFEPLINLRLDLGYINQLSQRAFDNNSGAGANAGSMLDMTFVANNPLSELVWSPHKGLSLKCADSSFTDKKSSMLRGEGPNDTSFVLTQSISAQKPAIDEPSEDEKFFTTQSPIALKYCCNGNDNLSSSNSGSSSLLRICGAKDVFMTGIDIGTDGDAKEINTMVGDSFRCSREKEDLQDNEKEDARCFMNGRRNGIPQINECNVSTLSDHTKKGTVYISPSNSDESKPFAADDQPLSENPFLKNEGIGSGPLGWEIHVLPSDVQPLKELRPANPLINMNFSGMQSLDNLESTAENDLQDLNGKKACGVGSRSVVAGPVHRVENCSPKDEKVHPRGTAVPSGHSPTSSRTRIKQRKGKEVQSDGDLDGRNSIEEGGSHESAESCNSAGLFSTRKRRWNFEHLLVPSKRVKRKIQEAPASSSFTGQDSSFLNWISNMMKGFSKSVQEEVPSLALTSAHPDNGNGSPNPELITWKKGHDTQYQCTGFQSLFRSLDSHSGRKGQEAGTFGANYRTKQSLKEIEMADRIDGANDIRVMRCHENSEQVLPMNENSKECASRNGADTLTPPKSLSLATLENPKTLSGENESSCNPVIGKDKDGLNSSIAGKNKINSAENVESVPSEVKTNCHIGNSSDPLESLWITRYYTRTSAPRLNLNQCTRTSKDGFQCSNDCTFLCSENDVIPKGNKDVYAVDLNSSGDRDVKTNAADTNALCEFDAYKSSNDQKSMCRVNSISLSSKFKSSEAMASIFARKLDAFKHIAPSNTTEYTAVETMSCFSCGTRGHRLQDCSETTRNEFANLSKNLSFCNGVKELPCFCIRCFQSNHWAAACPTAAPEGQHQSECQHKNMQLNFDSEVNSNGRNISGSGCEGKNSKEKKMPQSSNFVVKPVSKVPEGVFETVKRLRLSRADILKCLNSQMSMSHLDGLFLRLRLGKWEGLGGTGYYVACIMGEQNAMDSIYVNVGGIKCLVKSQYISNHDFLEDELMEWWCTASRDCSGCPLEADLRDKLKKKKLLGL